MVDPPLPFYPVISVLITGNSGRTIRIGSGCHLTRYFPYEPTHLVSAQNIRFGIQVDPNND